MLTTTRHTIRVLEGRKGIAVDEPVMWVVGLILLMVVVFAVMGMTVSISADGIPVTKTMLISIVCALGFA